MSVVTAYEPLKFYIAARWEDRDKCLAIRNIMEDAGLHCTSTWLTPNDEQSMDALAKKVDKVYEARKRAICDFKDIDEADGLLLYKPKIVHRLPTTGGHHVETGYALAKGKPVFVLGERENVFHYHPLVRVVQDMAAFFAALEVAIGPN